MKRVRIQTLAALIGGAAVLGTHGQILQTYHMPLPEDEVHLALETIDNFSGNVGSTLLSTISIVPSQDGTVLYYDHWEDGYESDISNPTQITSRIWGDNNPQNGMPPNFTNDVINAGDIIEINAEISVPRNAAVQEYDARDTFGVTYPVSVSRAMYALNPGQVLAGSTQIYPMDELGLFHLSPVGTDVGTNDVFEYSSLFVMASADGTVVAVDRDADGVTDETVILDEGETHVIDFVSAGASVEASRPAHVHLITGDIGSNYEMRWFTLHPRYNWDSDHFTPVGSIGDTLSEIFLFNPNTNAVTVTYETFSSTGTVAVSAGGVESFMMPTNSGARLYTADGAHFLPIQIMDAGESAAGNQAYDWGHDILPRKALTPVALVGWGPGSADPGLNGNPIWVTPESNTTIYIDYDGNPDTGPLTDARGNRYDYAVALDRLAAYNVYDTNDNDQTGMRIYTLDGVGLASAWGQAPDTAETGNPYLDMGNALLPFPTLIPTKEGYVQDIGQTNLVVDPGDILTYTIRVVRIGFDDQSDVVIFDPGVSNATYVTNSVRLNGSPLSDDTAPPAATPFPLDEDGLNIGPVDVGETNVITYDIQVLDPFPPDAPGVYNTVRVGNREFTLFIPVPAYGLTASKTSLPQTPLNPGDIIDYTITVENTGDVAQTGLRVTDPLPYGTEYVSNSTRVYIEGSFSNRLRDAFSLQQFSGNDGTVHWLGAWDELGEADGAQAGYVLVDGDGADVTRGFTLYIAGPQNGVQRMADLSSYTNAQLKLKYRRSGLDVADDNVALYVSDNGGGSWTTLDTYAGAATDSGYLNASYDISAYMSTNTLIRLLSPDTLETSDGVYFDDIEIIVQGHHTTNVGGPPSILADGYTLATGASAVVTFQLRVSDPATVTQIVNRAYVSSIQSPTPVSPQVTNTVNALSALSITKQSSIAEEDTLDPGDIITYTITLSNTGNIVQTEIILNDVLDDSLVYVDGSAAVFADGTRTVRDAFSSENFGNQDGTAAWSADWQESPESDGVSAGAVQITGGELMVRNNSAAARSVNLSGASNVIWSFDYREAGVLEDTDVVYFDVSTDGSSWTTLFSRNDDFGGPISTNFDISAYASSNTWIRYRVDYFGASDEALYIDNCKIAFEAGEIAGDPPPQMLFDVALNPGETIRVTFDAEAGVADQIINRACATSRQFPNGVCAAVTNGVDIIVLTQGVVVVEGSAESVQIAWNAIRDQYGEVTKDYDLLYVDAYDFTDALSTQWKLLGTIQGAFLRDTGQVSGVPPVSLNPNLMRFYRAARHNRWQVTNEVRYATRGVYALKRIPLVSGQNWVAVPGRPDTNTVSHVFGHRLPRSGSSVVDSNATRISWYQRTDEQLAYKSVFLNSEGQWQYAVGGDGPADAASVPLDEGVIMEVPSNCQFLTVGLVPTNSLQDQTFPGNPSTTNYALFSANAPRRLHPAQMGLVEAGFRATTWPDFVTHDLLWKWDRNLKVPPDYIVYWPAYGGWFSLTTMAPVPNNYFKPDDGIVICRPNAPESMSWSLPYQELYTPPTIRMNP